MNRQEALDAGGQCVLSDRNKSYGNPEDNFKNTADIWNVHLRGRGLLAPGKELDTRDVAALMVGLKLARLVTSPEKLDTWIDIIGYGACGAECASILAESAHSGHGSGSASSSVT
jgi:hypothetical protein